MPPPPSTHRQGPFTLPGSPSRALGRKARGESIRVVEFVEDLLRPTYGPKGLDKLVLDRENLVWITNESAVILSKVSFQHPVARILSELAETVNKSTGDGATAAVLLTCELLKKCVNIINLGVHPSIIVHSYGTALQLALKVCSKVSVSAEGPEQESLLLKLSSTAFASSLLSPRAAHLSQLAVRAISKVAKAGNGTENREVDLFNVHIEKASGHLLDSQLVEGFAFSHEIADDRMPKRVEPARVATLAGEIGKPNVERNVFKHSVLVEDPAGLNRLLQARAWRFDGIAEKIASTGANVVLLEKGIDPLASDAFARRGVMVIRRIWIDDLERLAKAVGSRIIPFHDDLKPDDLGGAGLVEIRKVAGDDWFVVERGRDAKSVTILLRSVNERVGDEAERALKRALWAVKHVVEKPRVIAGGGSFEIEAATEIRQKALELSGRHQLAVSCFADALEGMVEILAANAGLDPLRVLPELRAAHGDGMSYIGIDARERKISDMRELGILLPIRVQEQVLNSAVEAATLILRIGDIVLSKRSNRKDKAHDPDHNRQLYKDYKLESLEAYPDKTPPKRF